ncbi:MAG TPA: response regulator transcription factor [Pseudomonadales bacterium]
MIRILLADDHALYREGLRLLLERAGSFTIVGEAADGGEAVRLAFELLPDVILLDISMPVYNGIEATARIRKAWPHAKIVLLSMHEDETTILEALKAGVNGYVFKTQTERDLVHTIEVVADGAFFLGPNIPHSVIDALTHNASHVSDALTEREQQIVALIADGKTSREIAEILHLSPKTIESHRARIMQKLKLQQTTQLVCYAVRAQMQRLAPLR